MPSQTTVRVCSFPGCGRKHCGFGLCSGHLQQRNKGKDLTKLARRKEPPRIEYDEAPCPNPALDGPCHIYRGKPRKDGYCAVKINGKHVGVHAYVLALKLGRPVGKGMKTDHQCRVRSCCNPLHLREVTSQVNSTENVVGISWQINKGKTHCPHGHPYSFENTLVQRTGHRTCRTCKRIRERGRVR